MKTTPLPFFKSCTAMFSSMVDLPIPVFPITYMCLERPLALIPNLCRLPRKSDSAKYVTCSGSFITLSIMHLSHTLHWDPTTATSSNRRHRWRLFAHGLRLRRTCPHSRNLGARVVVCLGL